MASIYSIRVQHPVLLLLLMWNAVHDYWTPIQPTVTSARPLTPPLFLLPSSLSSKQNKTCSGTPGQADTRSHQKIGVLFCRWVGGASAACIHGNSVLEREPCTMRHPVGSARPPKYLSTTDAGDNFFGRGVQSRNFHVNHPYLLFSVSRPARCYDAEATVHEGWGDTAASF